MRILSCFVVSFQPSIFITPPPLSNQIRTDSFLIVVHSPIVLLKTTEALATFGVSLSALKRKFKLPKTTTDGRTDNTVLWRIESWAQPSPPPLLELATSTICYGERPTLFYCSTTVPPPQAYFWPCSDSLQLVLSV